MPNAAYIEFRELLRQRAFARAVAVAEREVAAAPEPSEFWLTQLAVALTRAGQHPRAMAAAEEALALAPDNAYALLARADARLAAGSVADARLDYEEAARRETVRDRARGGVLTCLGRQGQWQALLSRLAEWELAGETWRLWRIKALAGLGRTDEAIRECQVWLELSPDQPRALWQLTELEVQRDGLEPVLARMSRLARIPSRPSVYGEIYASLCRRAGKTEAAVQQYSKLTAGSTDPRHRRQQAFLLAKSGQESTAMPLMEELLRLDPRDMYLHSAYVAACRRVGRLDQAACFYQELVSRFPDERALLGRLRKVDGMAQAERRRGIAAEAPAAACRSPATGTGVGAAAEVPAPGRAALRRSHSPRSGTGRRSSLPRPDASEAARPDQEPR